ncbi:MAG: hypothetical protein ACK4SX_05530 [Alcanivoracaceae bacterium]
MARILQLLSLPVMALTASLSLSVQAAVSWPDDMVSQFEDPARAAEMERIASISAGSGMQALNDDVLSDITGQLFFSDKIQGVPIHGITNNFTFYRIGLEADLRFNLNIDKLQLGCGGFNDALVANACDLDADFLRFAGFGGPGTDFQLEFPYLELAIKNDGDRTRREVAGIKIGAATAEGLLSIGRRYTAGQVNQEWGLINGLACTPSTSATQDDGRRLACSSGANRLSGFLLGELSANGRITDFGGADVCQGWTSINVGDPCTINQRLFLAFSGTRMDRIGVYSRDNELITYNCGGLLAFLGCPNANFKLSQSLRMLHDIKLTSVDPAPGQPGPRVTRDFFLSFQRERIAYPIYDQSQPYATVGPPVNYGPPPATGGCSAANQTAGLCRQSLYDHVWETSPARVSSWSAPTNTGWWMNITYADLRNQNVGNLSLGGLFDALNALSAGGTLQDLNLGQTPVKNCFGTATFC